MSSLQHILQKVIQPRRLAGTILEIGPGSIWPGLLLLKTNTLLDLKGIGYSPEERKEALDLAKQCDCRMRVDFLMPSPGESMPLEDRSVDAVISFGALHTWQQPTVVFNEIARVLKINGDFFIGDVRQDVGWWSGIWAAHRHRGLKAVYRAKKQALSLAEFHALLANTSLEQGIIQTYGPDVWVINR